MPRAILPPGCQTCAAVRWAKTRRRSGARGAGLTYDTVGPVAALPEVAELNIGHFLIGEAVVVGMPQAIAEMRNTRSMMEAARAPDPDPEVTSMCFLFLCLAAAIQLSGYVAGHDFRAMELSKNNSMQSKTSKKSRSCFWTKPTSQKAIS